MKTRVQHKKNQDISLSSLFDNTDHYKQESVKTSILFGPIGSQLLNHFCFHTKTRIPHYTRIIEDQVYVTQTYEQISDFLCTTRKTVCKKIKELLAYDLLEVRKIHGLNGLAFRVKNDIRLKLIEITAGIKPTGRRKKIKEIRQEVWEIFKGWLSRKAAQINDFLDKSVNFRLTPRAPKVNDTLYIYREKGENPPSLRFHPVEEGNRKDGSVSNTEADASPRGALSLPETVALERETAEQPKPVARTLEDWDGLIAAAPSAFLKDLFRQQRDEQYLPIKTPNVVYTVEIKPVDEEMEGLAYVSTKEGGIEENEPVFESSEKDFQELWLETLSRKKEAMAKKAELETEARNLGIQQKLARKLDAIKKRYQKG